MLKKYDICIIGGMILTREREVLGEQLIKLSLCPPQIQRAWMWDRTQGSVLTGQQITSCNRSSLRIRMISTVYVEGLLEMKNVKLYSGNRTRIDFIL